MVKHNFMSGWNVCKFDLCESWTRRKDGDYCATHERSMAKHEEQGEKDYLKRKKQIELQKIKQKEPRKTPKRMSDKRKTESQIYKEKRQEFLLKHWCAYHGRPCIPTTVHHAKGRIGSLYLDETYWVALCMPAHEWVENNPDKAKELGLSESRLATQTPTI